MPSRKNGAVAVLAYAFDAEPYVGFTRSFDVYDDGAGPAPS